MPGQAFAGTNTTAYGIKDGFLRFDSSGVFEFDLSTATTYNAGDLFGLNVNGGNNGLLTQQVVSVGSPQLAIGRAIKPGTSGTRLLCKTLIARNTPNFVSRAFQTWPKVPPPRCSRNSNPSSFGAAGWFMGRLLCNGDQQVFLVSPMYPLVEGCQHGLGK
jgi:hypothetical protein